VAEPASRFQSDYLAYRNGEITQPELIARLPHVAMIGDSVCMNVCISSILSTSWRARTCRGRNWFLDINPSPKSVRSVSKRLEKLTPFIATEYAGVGAMVDEEDAPQGFGPHSDQERILEEALYKHAQFFWEAVTTLAARKN